MEYDRKPKCSKGKKNKGEVKCTKKWCSDATFLFKVSFNQLTYKLSFMRNWCFVLAIPRIEKQSREEAFKQSADDISVGTYVTIIKFTYEKQIENKLLFLDILVSNIKNLEISVFNRKTYTGLLLNLVLFQILINIG